MYTEGSGEREARCSRDGPYSPAFEAYVGDGDDRVRLESSVDPLIDGGEGNDELDASASGSNTPSMRGGGGDDRLVGSGRPDDDGDGWVGDFLEGGPGADVLEDSEGTNRLYGGEGDDQITGGFGADTLGGFDGDDRLVGRGQSDVLFCGDGVDRHNGVKDEWKSRNISYPASIHHGLPASGECELDTSPYQGAGRDSLTETEARVTERRYLWYTAAPGQANDVSVTHEDGDLLLTDPGAKIRAENGCAAVAGSDGHQVRCPGAAKVLLVDLDLADGDDRATVQRPAKVDTDLPSDDEQRREIGSDRGLTQARIHGGPGADTASGTSGLLWVRGGDGDDRASGSGENRVRFQGEPGNDHLVSGNTTENVRLEGDEGDDELVGTSRAQNEIEGGAGRDTLTGSDRPYRAVPLDGSDQSLVDYLHGGPDDDVIETGHGQSDLNGNGGDDVLRAGLGLHHLSGEDGNDRLVGPEGGADVRDRTFAWGGPGDDLVSGGAGGDSLDGGDGMDEVQGGSGNDTLFGGNDSDRLFGEAGYDVLRGGPSDDLLSCGANFDHIVSDAGDVVGGDCEFDETLERDFRLSPGDREMSALGLVTMPMRCRSAREHGCRGELALVRRGKTAGRASVSLRPGQRRQVRVGVSSAVRREVRRERAVRATVRVTTRTRGGVRRYSKPVTLRAQR